MIAGLAVALGLYGLLGVIRPAFAPPPPATVANPVAPLRFGDLTLVGVELDALPVLYWQLDAQGGADYRTVLRVVAPDGTLVWEWRRSPGAGRFSTDRWPPGYVMRDAYIVNWPEWAGPGAYLVEVGVQPFGEELLTPNDTGVHPYAPLGTLEYTPVH